MEIEFDKVKKEIARICQKVRNNANSIVILVVINTKSKTEVVDDYENFSVKSEYFSDAEVDEIVNGFLDIGCKVDFSNGEQEFIKKLANNEFDKYKGLQKIVYNSS